MDCIFTIELLDLSFGDVHRSHDDLKAGDAASLSSMQVDVKSFWLRAQGGASASRMEVEE